MMTSAIRIIFIVVCSGVLAACTTTGDQSTGFSRYEEATTDIEQAMSAWQEKGDYATAVYRLETVLQEYDGYMFERRILGTLSLLHLQYGNTTAFLDSMQRLEEYYDRDTPVSEQYQHLFTTAFAMQGKPAESLPGRGYDPNRVQATYQVLGTRP